MPLLWLLVLVPAGLICLGAVLYALGDFDPPSRGFSLRHMLTDILTMASAGQWGAVMLGIVLAPGLVLFFVGHLSYEIRAWIGLPIGFALLVYVSHFLFVEKENEKNGPDEPIN